MIYNNEVFSKSLKLGTIEEIRRGLFVAITPEGDIVNNEIFNSDKHARHALASYWDIPTDFTIMKDD